ncbi:MAG TPA: DUF4134 domain-containing protein [Puia sp.]
MKRKKLYRRLGMMIAAVLIIQWVQAQTADGNNGLTQANTLVRSYFDTGTQLMYGIGAILAIVGAIRVYTLWGERNGEASRAAASWFGACIFLVVVSTVIRSFFGL